MEDIAPLKSIRDNNRNCSNHRKKSFFWTSAEKYDGSRQDIEQAIHCARHAIKSETQMKNRRPCFERNWRHRISCFRLLTAYSVIGAGGEMLNIVVLGLDPLSNVNQQALYPPLAELLNGYCQMLVFKRVANRRIAAEHLNSPAAERGIVVVKIAVVQLHLVKEVVYAHVAVSFVGGVVKLYKLVDYLIGFVPDVPHELFENVFHCYYAHRSAVLVSHNDHMALLLLHNGKHVGQRSRLVDEIHGHHLFADVDVL